MVAMTVHDHLVVERAALEALLEEYGELLRSPRCLVDEGWLRYNMVNMAFLMQQARVRKLEALS